MVVAAFPTLNPPEIKMKHYIAKIAVVILSGFAVATGLRAGPSADDVGDAETFGHPALYMGAASGFVTLSTDPCPSPTPTPSPPSTVNNDQCFQIVAAPGTTNFDAQDIARIKLPKKATRNIIYPVLNIFLDYQLENSTGASVPNALFRFTAGTSIESDALLDPSVIDPGTGLPAAGRLTFVFNYNFRDDRSMKDGDRQRIRETLVRAGNTGLTRRQFIESFGLSPAVVDAMFTGPMTIRLNVVGSARYCTEVSITGNMRLFGD